MATDYAAIKAENQRKYGTDIGRIGPLLLAHRYQDRTHFIFELLQNAEDALARRGSWNGPRAVDFKLSSSSLEVSHFGIPFSADDIRGICGIAEGTKDLTSIGRFGIGFKSVYAFTDRPEIHSGDEHFVVDCFVWPEAALPIDLKPNETRFILPLRQGDVSASTEISCGLKQLGVRTLLFLKEIEEISWSVDNGPSGSYLRGKPEEVAENARRITVIGQNHGDKDLSEEDWLIFSREVHTSEGKRAGHAEIGFSLKVAKDRKILSVCPVNDCVLVVFFPTIVPTNTGFLIQGPYRTTPSRDNVPRDDAWNRYLVTETAALLLEVLRSLRELNLMSASALSTAPIDWSKFGERNLFSPLFNAVRNALASEALIPSFGSGYLAARDCRLARTQELRELVSPAQFTALFQAKNPLGWVTEEITQDRTPELRQYLMQELNVPELRPEDIVPMLTKEFLENQSDEWVTQLYEFLNGQLSLLRSGRLGDVPLVRLENGDHVRPKLNGQPQAFLPGPISTGFPTVRTSVCVSKEARALLIALGLTEPDPVDDVMRNVLPQYTNMSPPLSPADYGADIKRIVRAFGTDSKSRRDALVLMLRTCPFLAAIDSGTGKRCFAKPLQVYIATERLKTLFDGVPYVLMVDDSYDCLRGEEVRELLEACGATRYLERMQVNSDFAWDEKAEMRRKAGCENVTWGEQIEDFTLRGLDELLARLPMLDLACGADKARLLWEALCDVEDRRGTRAFSGTYRWFYYQWRDFEFDAAFVRRLNEVSWVPDRNGTLSPPSFVLFEETAWRENQFLLSKIRFRPPIIETLAREAGIEPGVLDLLKKLGVTSEAELKARLGITEETTKPLPTSGSNDLTVDEALQNLGIKSEPTPPVEGSESDLVRVPGGRGVTRPGSPAVGVGTGHGGSSGSADRSRDARRGGSADLAGKVGHARRAGSADGRPFISYVGAHPDEEEPDPDGLDQQQRLALEDKAITLILTQEAQLQRAPRGNPGFDLIEPGPEANPARWIEVKAMSGDLHSRPVGLSRTQFKSAQEHGDRYWLYVVEHAGTPATARIVRIQDPAGKARTFTFDRGWISVAEISDTESQEQSNKE